jgi:hypothetical protein
MYKAMNGKHYQSKRDAQNYDALFKDLLKALGKANPAALNNEATKKHLVKAIERAAASGDSHADKFEAALKYATRATRNDVFAAFNKLATFNKRMDAAADDEVKKVWTALDGKRYDSKDAALKANERFKKGHDSAASRVVPPRASAESNPDAAGDGVQTTVTVNGVAINLDDVSPSLRRQYHETSKSAAKHDDMRAELQAVGEQMLAEVFPKMAMKAATLRPLSDHAAINDLMKRSR